MEDRKKRKYQSRLRMGALGVVAFGVWGIIKSFITILTSEGGMASLVTEGDPEVMMPIVIAMVIIMVAFTLFVRLTIGFCARAESKGKLQKHRNFYIVLVILELLISAVSIFVDVVELISATDDLLDTFFLLVMEATNAFALCEVMHSAVNLRKMEKMEAGK